MPPGLPSFLGIRLMHWPPPDAPVPDSAPPSWDDVTPAGPPPELGGDEHARRVAPADSVSTFDVGAAGFGAFLPAESPWANRAVWLTAAASVVALGVWQAGLWEVALEESPAGVATAPGFADDPADLNLGGAAPADDAAGDPLADWGADLADTAAAGPSGGHSGATAAAAVEEAEREMFELLGMGEGDAVPPRPSPELETVDFAPPAGGADTVAAAESFAAPADPWGTPEPADLSAIPADDATGFAGDPFGDFADPPPVRPPVPARDAVRTVSAEDEGAGRVTTAGSAAGRGGFDPFAAEVAAPPADPAPSPASAPVPASGATDEPRTAAESNAAAPDAAGAELGGLLAAVDGAIDGGEVLQAHAALSRVWWDDPAARATIRGRLDRTAAAIYFDAASAVMTPRRLAPGETLGDVAKEHAVPPMYLARVNGVSPRAVPAGTELKVVRGPFGAAADLSGPGAGGFTIHAHGYYVRGFAATLAGVKPGDYTVLAKVRGGRRGPHPADGPGRVDRDGAVRPRADRSRPRRRPVGGGTGPGVRPAGRGRRRDRPAVTRRGWGEDGGPGG